MYIEPRIDFILPPLYGILTQERLSAELATDSAEISIKILTGHIDWIFSQKQKNRIVTCQAVPEESISSTCPSN